ncbi:phage holin family protein [Pedobacter sp. BS3]|uniref:phage holin family protein n=1 Tax=Pedobacter sp. BS3 TaxID=2567937 RepID=UPI0011EF943E|nr:phage holin family protein [Pedobacter sp. BS3]TZF81814.1 phage holin family protein [Pedobacter sp. BS3]
MKNYFVRLLQTFDYSSILEFVQSLAPSSKYKLTTASLFISTTAPVIDRLFGLDTYAFCALIVVFLAELVSGIWASHIRGEVLSSMKLSRFTFKCAYYLILIAVPYLLSTSFTAHGKDVAAALFDWLHIFFVAQITLENMVSILENLSVISGKDKTHWISKIQDKINSLLN